MSGISYPSGQRDASTSSTSDSRGSTDEQIAVSHHAQLRWLQRADGHRRRLDAAWQSAHPVELARPDTGFSEVRYDKDTECLLCAADGTLTTVLHAENEAVRPPGGAHSPVCAGCSRPRENTAKPCPDCGIRTVVHPQSSDHPPRGGAR